MIAPIFSGLDRGAGEVEGLWVDTDGVFWRGMWPHTRVDAGQPTPVTWPKIDEDLLTRAFAAAETPPKT